ncbi:MULTISPECIES: DNA polymerase I [unclassified Wenzhouxiangella]|uniref:DNA polymerase I n=1 Tax=unclassified Wenzhouxiangella TaxID=2613841 RepID=UPI000E328395|nr:MULTISPECIES: DNA polymerase I [unclassified Wenzhouxiangella]RFF27226.1 DNA polymerase I [Wenzhouxiangella sp. 15181]RFP69718.1 DNA polymerase I [Wenzhouxiangella sp. 15190]
MSKKPLCLVDGSSYLYRAFHALPSLTSGDGQPTGAIFGVANMVRRMLEHYDPDHVAVIFDAPGKTFRHETYADYKSTRPPMPEELKSQLEPLHELIDAMGLPRLVIEGVEADDVIATLTRQAREAGMPVLISSGDKDLAQLVTDGVVLEDTMQDKRYDPEAVEEKFGVGPELVADLLALTGDTSDNIPGVEKVGPKTAAKWLKEYGDLDGVIEHADEIGGKIGENLRGGLDQLRLSRELVTLDESVDLEGGLEMLGRGEPDRERMVELLKRFGFSTWLKQYSDGDGDGPSSGSDLEVETVTTKKQLEALVETLESAELIAFDTETTSLEPLDAELVGFSFAVEAGKAWYVPLAHADQDNEFTFDEAIEALRGIIEDESRAKVGQHLKYDLNVLERAGIALGGIKHDTMLESYTFHSTATRHDMDSLASRYLGRQTTSYEAVAGKGKSQVSFDQVPVATAAEYAGEDAEVTLALHEHLWPRLEQLDGPSRVYRELEIPLIHVLARMERTGVALDADVLAQQSSEIHKRLDELVETAYAEAGREFNLGSPRQLQEILFEQLGLPVKRKTPKGQPSTAEDVLQELAIDGHELPKIILEHRGLAKLKNTYTDRLPERIHPRTGRVHTHYHQAVAATGRLSSTDPNLQNIPIRTHEGRRIRKAFIAPQGTVLLAADYSQIELRIMAHLSGDERLLKAFADGEDIHRATAAEVFGLAVDEVGDNQRRAAKAINFGLMYGMSAWGLSRQLELPRSEAQDYIERYFDRYPGVRDFMDDIRERARKQGYVETLFGRRLWADEINSRNGQRRQAAERAAINAPMQGTAADIIKRAMIDVDAWIQAEDVPAKLVMQVHDELILEVDKGVLESVREGVVGRMQRAAELKVELLVEANSGPDWETAH